MEMINLGTTLIAFFAGCVFTYKLMQPKQEEDKLEQNSPPPTLKHGMVFDYIKAADVITHANHLKNQMLTTEDMLTSAEMGQTIRACWDAGSSGSYTLTTSKAVALAERRRIRTLLLADIDTLCYMRLYGITPTVTPTQRESD